MIVRIKTIYDDDMRAGKWLVIFNDKKIKAGKICIDKHLVFGGKIHSFYYIDAKSVEWNKCLDCVFIETR
jgi:hypothetical protein